MYLLTALNLALHGWQAVRVDIDRRIIPNRLLLSLCVFQCLIFVIQYRSDWPEILLQSLIGGVVVLIPYVSLSLLSQGKFGMGDAKALAVTSAILISLSWQSVVLHLVITHLIGLTIGLYALAKKSTKPIAYAIPIFLSATLVVMFSAF
ncbi:MAG: prepilin peptidase [Candidatus Nanopelagicales bacterium]